MVDRCHRLPAALGVHPRTGRPDISTIGDVDDRLRDRSDDGASIGDGGPDDQVGETSGSRRGRGTLSIALMVVTALLAPLTVVAGWARAQIEDTDRYVATVGPLAQDPRSRRTSLQR